MTSRNLCAVVVIPPPAGEEIDAARKRYDQTEGKLPAHITVLPPFHVDNDVMPEVIAHFDAVASRTAPFELRLAGTDTFTPRSSVVFVSVADGLADLDLLERSMRASSFAPVSRRPYRPHVTLAHRASDDVLDAALADLAGFEAIVRIEWISLFEHRDRRWERLRAFAFGG